MHGEVSDPQAVRAADQWWDHLDPDRRVQIHRWVDGRDRNKADEIPGQVSILDQLGGQ